MLKPFQNWFGPQIIIVVYSLRSCGNTSQGSNQFETFLSYTYCNSKSLCDLRKKMMLVIKDNKELMQLNIVVKSRFIKIRIGFGRT